MAKEVSWDKARAELHDELLALGRPDLWETIDSYSPPEHLAASEYHVKIAGQRIAERHGADGVEVFGEALKRVTARHFGKQI